MIEYCLCCQKNLISGELEEFLILQEKLIINLTQLRIRVDTIRMKSNYEITMVSITS